MTTTIEATYENGVLRLPALLPLPEKAHVIVTIQSETPPGQDAERDAWQRVSEEALTATWANPDDGVFDELLQR
jgi:predicted DNA-binding antitoxin AbrB/MazE fold protein